MFSSDEDDGVIITSVSIHNEDLERHKAYGYIAFCQHGCRRYYQGKNFSAVKGLVRENSRVMNFTDENSFSQDTETFFFNIESYFRSRFPFLEPAVSHEQIPHRSGMFIFYAYSTHMELNSSNHSYSPLVFPEALEKFTPNENELASLEKLNNDIVIPSGSKALKFSPILWSTYT